jgi:hypothetical protein
MSWLLAAGRWLRRSTPARLGLQPAACNPLGETHLSGIA